MIKLTYRYSLHHLSWHSLGIEPLKYSKLSKGGHLWLYPLIIKVTVILQFMKYIFIKKRLTDDKPAWNISSSNHGCIYKVLDRKALLLMIEGICLLIKKGKEKIVWKLFIIWYQRNQNTKTKKQKKKQLFLSSMDIING